MIKETYSIMENCETRGFSVSINENEIQVSEGTLMIFRGGEIEDDELLFNSFSFNVEPDEDFAVSYKVFLAEDGVMLFPEIVRNILTPNKPILADPKSQLLHHLMTIEVSTNGEFEVIVKRIEKGEVISNEYEQN